MLNLKTEKIKAYSAQEAQVAGPFYAYAKGANCTQAWKNAGSPTDPDALNDFMVQQLEKKTQEEPGIGLYIVIERGSRNKSTRPYTYQNVSIKPYQKSLKSYLLVGDNNTILQEVKSNKRSDAVKAAREFYSEGYKGNIQIKMIKTVPENTVGTFEYKPSKGCTLGEYLLFGIDKPL